MIEPFLRSQLEPVARRQRLWRLSRDLAVCWAAAALIALVFVGVFKLTGWRSPSVLPIIGLATLAGALSVWFRSRKWQPDYRHIARRVEEQHPQLHALLLTAVEQQPDAATGRFNFLQERLIREAIVESMEGRWQESVSTGRLIGIQLAQVLAFILLLTVLTGLRVQAHRAPAIAEATRLNVSPGDALVERGNGLAILARFEGPLPPEVTLVIRPDAAPERQVTLAKSLNDPIFGGTIPEITNALSYHVLYAGQRSRDFKVQVFEFPRLERADAHLAFPGYTGLAEKTVQDTRRVSAVEGASLDLALHLNKPVASARLIAKDKSVVPLATQTNHATAALSSFPLRTSQVYELLLVDDAGRTNKVPTQFIVEVLTNRTPELKFLAPRGDQRVSPLEEVNFQAEVWDDFGVKNYGLTYTLAGGQPQTMAFGAEAPAREKRQFGRVVSMEELGAQPDQLLSYFIWADDIGPDGQLRRSASDMYYAEVRPLEELFREAQSQPQSESEQQQNSQGNEVLKLADLQKQIINATWKLQRDSGIGLDRAAKPARRNLPSSYSSDVKVISESQADALKQAGEKKAQSQNAESKALWDAVEKEMRKAGDELSRAEKTPDPLPPALAAEQAAYQALLKLASHEFQVGRRGQRGSPSSNQRNQRQLDQLDLTQSENRYENQKTAAQPQNQEQREQLQVSSRLKELAQRQQDLNERLKELQTALQEAKSEQEKEEIRRRLKRLREEEQQMLANVDELLQRMDRPENQSGMSEAKKQLEQTRNQVQRASEAMDKESVGQALSSGTRAEREMRDLREDLRKKNSAQFAEDMRQMRSDARDLAQKEEQLGQKLQSMQDDKRKSLSDSGDVQKVLGQMDQQKEKMTNLLQQISRVSQDAEVSEPLLSKQLYDTLRKASQGNPDQALQKSGELLKLGFVNEASQFEQKAHQEVDQVKQGVERAAESVLGDETETLRMARRELDDLARQVEKELAEQERRQAGQPGTNATAQAQGAQGQNRPGSRGAPGEQNQDPQAAGEQAAGQRPNGERAPTESPQPGTQPGQERSQAGQSRQGTAQSGARPGDPPQPQPGQAQGQNQPQGQGQGQGQQGNPPGENANAAGNPEPNASPNRAPSNRPRQRPSLTGEPRPSQPNPGGQPQPGQGRNQVAGGGGGEGGDQNRERSEQGPIVGEGYADWADRLREVEETVDVPDVRDQVARVRERARTLRMEYKKQSKPPQWAVVRGEIAKPLAEARDRINEELARRESKDSLVPIDRDPVPQRYSELVRRYYEKLGGSESSTPAPRP
jgi:hypothetical protein